MVKKTNKFNNMCFYDYEDNYYDADITKKQIIGIAKDVEENNLYSCYPSLLFKVDNFDPILYTCLNSPNEYDEEYYKKVDYKVVLI